MVVRLLVTILALASGVLHLALDMVLYRGNFGFFRLGEAPQRPPPAAAAAPPPGATPPPQLPLPLQELFVLNFIGWVVLVVAFWLAPRAWAWLVDVAMILYTLAIIAGWMYIRAPNPMNLGYISKVIEVVLIIVLLVHLWQTLPRRIATALPA